MLFKKGNSKDCGNYRTIALISHTSKVLLIIILNRMRKKVEEELSDVQAGYRSNRGTIDHSAQKHPECINNVVSIVQHTVYRLPLLCPGSQLIPIVIHGDSERTGRRGRSMTSPDRDSDRDNAIWFWTLLDLPLLYLEYRLGH